MNISGCALDFKSSHFSMIAPSVSECYCIATIFGMLIAKVCKM